jgi:hypothetical protein
MQIEAKGTEAKSEMNGRSGSRFVLKNSSRELSQQALKPKSWTPLTTVQNRQKLPMLPKIPLVASSPGDTGLSFIGADAVRRSFVVHCDLCDATVAYQYLECRPLLGTSTPSTPLPLHNGKQLFSRRWLAQSPRRPPYSPLASPSLAPREN